jgi:HlyD family secretion protein
MMKKLLPALLLVLFGCSPPPDRAWLGYGEGDFVYVAAPQPGWLRELEVERGTEIHRNQLLFVLDSTSQQASHDQAEAALAQSRAALNQERANLDYARAELTRQNNLARDGAGVPSQRDLAQSNYQQSKARISQLEAQIGEMQASLSGAAYGLSQRQIVSETDGSIQDIYFRPGEYVPASTPVLSVLPPANVYVRFFVPETQLAKVHLGEKVRISCDGCKPMTATITFIAAQEEYTPPVIFSIGNREKLVFKLEARAPGGLPLHPGQPVDVSPL